VTDTWLVAGTTTASVKKSLDAMSGGGESLAAEMQEAGDPVPSEPVTRWGVLRPAQGADVLLDWAERLAGRERIEQAKKMINLAEVMRLVERFTWQRTDEPTVIRGDRVNHSGRDAHRRSGYGNPPRTIWTRHT